MPNDFQEKSFSFFLHAVFFLNISFDFHVALGAIAVGDSGWWVVGTPYCTDVITKSLTVKRIDGDDDDDDQILPMSKQGFSFFLGHAAAAAGFGLFFGCCCCFCRAAETRLFFFSILQTFRAAF